MCRKLTDLRDEIRRKKPWYSYDELARKYGVNKFYLWNIYKDDDYIPPDRILLVLGIEAPVKLIAVGNVHPGSLVLGDSRKCWCGIWFIGRTWNQKYHSKECRKIHRRHTHNAHSI